MKKTLLLLASVALLLVGCQKENFVEQQDGKLVDATFTASLESGVATRAAVDGDGAAASVNRCIMEIYYGDALFTRQYAPVNDQKKATFTAQVVSNRTYTVAFWADKVDNASTDAGLAIDKYYKTTSLKEITINGSYVGNDDARDAFFVCKSCKVEQGGTAFTAELKRPFAQMNVITTDWDKVTTVDALKPEKVNVTLKNALVAFNAVTGEASGSQTLNYEAAVYTPAAHGAEKTLSMDYLFASADKAVIDIDWKAKKTGDDDVAHAFASVPYQRNYRTNIKGALLTTQGQWTVTVEPDWTGNGTTVEGGEDPYLVNYFAAGSIAAANEALKTKNAVSIENPTDLGTAIVIPVEQDGKSVYIKVSGASSGDIKVKKADNGPASLAIESDSKTLNIDLPNSHVDVNNGVNYTSITAKTGGNTLVIGKDVVADALDVQKGSVEIHGKVASLTRAAGISAKFYASDGTTLANYVTWAKAGETVELECDIDLVGTTWNSPVLNADFNGNNHIIKNIKNPICAPDYAGLFKISYSNIKNVIIQNAEFAYGQTMDARGGALVGDMRRGSIENCHVDGIKFDGYQKVGGLVGFLSANADNGTDISIKNCSVKNATFAACGADDKYLYQTGGLIGYLVLGNRNISISNCSVETIKYGNAHNGVFNDASDNHGYLSHTFVGTIFSQTNNAANTLAFTANTISGDNTPLNASMYGSAYFGWARNPEYSDETVTLGKITIDGEEWTPNYPFKNVTTGKGYATLDAALTALKASETLEIWKAGEYTVQTLSTPANTTIDAKVDGVVFNRTPGGWVANQIDGRTVKNITWNVGSANYQYFHGVNLVNCKVNGLLITHSNNTYTDCEFYNADDYNFWEYGSGSTFTGCKFTCPGGTKGGAVNAYNEGEQGLKKVVFENCEFVALNESTKYAAVYIKPESSFDIEFTNCTANDKFCTGAISGSKLWNVKDNSNLKTKVTVDDQLVYANGTVLAISTPAQLKNFADAVNAGKSFKGLTAFLVNDIDLAGETVTPIGAGDKKFDGTFDGKGKTISNIEINGSSNGTALFGHVWEATIKNLKITNAKVTNTALDYTGILAGNGYANISGCDINGTVEGQEQVGAVIGYLSCGSIMNCKVDATVKGTSRVGVLCAKANVDSQYKIEGNTIKGSATSNDIYAGGVVGQIMCGTGKVWTIKNNSIDATVSTGGSLIGNVRNGNWDAFAAGYQTNVTGNTWTAAGNCKITDGNPEHSVEISK